MHHAWSNKGRSKKRQLCKKRKFNGNIGKIKKKLRKLGEFKTFVEIGLKYAICIIGRPLLSSRPSWLVVYQATGKGHPTDDSQYLQSKHDDSSTERCSAEI